MIRQVDMITKLKYMIAGVLIGVVLCFVVIKVINIKTGVENKPQGNYSDNQKHSTSLAAILPGDGEPNQSTLRSLKDMNDQLFKLLESIESNNSKTIEILLNRLAEKLPESSENDERQLCISLLRKIIRFGYLLHSETYLTWVKQSISIAQKHNQEGAHALRDDLELTREMLSSLNTFKTGNITTEGSY